MTHPTPNTSSLQSLLFDTEDFSSCFFRKPSDHELEFLSFYTAVQQLLSPAELIGLLRGRCRGRAGYDLLSILVPRSENHHPAIIDKACFELVQEMRRLRTNVITDEQGNKVCKNTHYSMKLPFVLMEGQIGSEEA